MNRQSRRCSLRGVTRAVLIAAVLGAATTSTVLAQLESPSGAEGTAAAPLDGGALFRQTCVPCHGDDGKGGQGGGAPLDSATDVGAVMSMVRDGRGNMPPLGEALTPDQIAAVADYVVNGLFKQASP